MSQASLNQFLPKIISDAMLQDQLKDVTDKAAFTRTLLRLGKVEVWVSSRATFGQCR